MQKQLRIPFADALPALGLLPLVREEFPEASHDELIGLAIFRWTSFLDYLKDREPLVLPAGDKDAPHPVIHRDGDAFVIEVLAH